MNMRILKTIFLIFCINSTFGQNVVVNGSFENQLSCPDWWSTLSQDQISKSDGWYRPTQGTPDFFHSCGLNGANIPNTFKGYMNPDNIIDSAFAGMSTFAANTAPSAFIEYIAHDISSLTIGTLYHVTLKIIPSPYSSLYTDCFGVYFVTSSNVIDTTTQRIIVNPQINYADFGIQSDSLNWQMLVGNFVADSAYTKIIIGCFENNDSIDVIQHLTGVFGYYFFDEICISSNINDCFQQTGVSENNNNDEITIYPNPTKGEININFLNDNSGDEGNLIISDLIGNKIYQGKILLGTNYINIESYPKGIYFLNIFIGGNQYMKKIILN
jgi:hypothetical protein